MSKEDLSDLLLRMSGTKPYSKSHLQNTVIAEAQEVTHYLQAYDSVGQLSFNFVDEVDIYNADTEEIIYLDDAVGVKRQKEFRNPKDSTASKSSKTVQTDVIGIGNQQTGFTYLSSAEASFLACSLEDLIRQKLSKDYGGKPLPLIAITDEATAIRKVFKVNKINKKLNRYFCIVSYRLCYNAKVAFIQGLAFGIWFRDFGIWFSWVL